MATMNIPMPRVSTLTVGTRSQGVDVGVSVAVGTFVGEGTAVAGRVGAGVRVAGTVGVVSTVGVAVGASWIISLSPAKMV